MEAAYFKRALTTGRRVRERAMDGLEAFRVNRLRREAEPEISGKEVRLVEPDLLRRRVLPEGHESNHLVLAPAFGHPQRSRHRI